MVDSCPSVTQRNRRAFAINRLGLVFQLLQDDNLTQEYYETTCRRAAAGGGSVDPDAPSQLPCRFVDARLAPYSRCVQQWSYVYAMGRPIGLRNDRVHLDYIRIPTGCKCRLSASAVAAILDGD